MVEACVASVECGALGEGAVVAQEYGVDAFERVVGVAGLREVGPGRVHDGGGGERETCVPRGDDHRGRQAPAGGASEDRDVLRGVVLEECSIDGDPVFDGCGEGVLRRHAVVDRHDPVAGGRETEPLHRTHVAATDRVATAVQVDEYGLRNRLSGRRRREDADRDAGEALLLHAYSGRFERALEKGTHEDLFGVLSARAPLLGRLRQRDIRAAQVDRLREHGSGLRAQEVGDGEGWPIPGWSPLRAAQCEQSDGGEAGEQRWQ